MFDRFISFLKQIEAPKTAGSADDPRVAAAALMFHVINADGVLEPAEMTRLRELLSTTYQIEGVALETLISAGAEADRESIDFYAFTSVLCRHLDEDGRKDFIGFLWAMVYSDGEMHELEDDTVWRVSELLGVDNRDRVELRRKAKAKAGDRAS